MLTMPTAAVNVGERESRGHFSAGLGADTTTGHSECRTYCIGSDARELDLPRTRACPHGEVTLGCRSVAEDARVRCARSSADLLVKSHGLRTHETTPALALAAAAAAA